MNEQSPPTQQAIIEHGLTDENCYYACGMTDEQIRRAAQIILTREAEDHDVRHALEQRRYKARKLNQEDVA